MATVSKKRKAPLNKQTKRKKRKATLDEQMMLNLDLFLKFYNSLYLQEYEEMFRGDPDLMDQVKTYMNPVQEELFNNMFLSKKSQPIFIDGPIVLYVFKSITTENQYKTFYLFGEKHMSLKETEASCSQQFGQSVSSEHVNKFLKNQLLVTSQFLDIYLEVGQFSYSKNYDLGTHLADWLTWALRQLISDYQLNTEKLVGFLFADLVRDHPPSLSSLKFNVSSKGYQMLDLFQKLKPCLNPTERSHNKEMCQFCRVHFIDIRQSYTLENIFDILHKMTVVRQYLEIFFENTDLFQQIKLTLDDFLAYKPPTVSKFTFSVGFLFNLLWSFQIPELLDMMQADEASIVQLLKHIYNISPILTKEMNKTSLKDLIFEIVGKQLYTKLIVNKQSHAVWQNLKELQGKMYLDELNDETRAEELFQTFLLNCKNLYTILLDLISRIMDCYCLARVFRQFLPKEGQPPPEQPEYPTTYMIYSGANHTEMYAVFIQELIERGILMLTEPVHASVSPKDTYCVQLPPPSY
jgi:hypothetical protein